MHVLSSLPWNQIFISVGFLCATGVVLAILLILAERRILNYGVCTIDINKGKKKIDLNGGGSLLSGLAENGIYIPSACGGRGSCAYCKLKVLSGGGAVGPVELPSLSNAEMENNIRLSCQVKVRGAMSISVPDELFSVRKFRAKVAGKRALTHDIIELKMELVEPREIDFTAGQYVQLESRKYKGRESVNRAYSISSLPSEKGFVELMIRRVPEGICTTWVFDHLKEGDEINFSGPYGDFRLTDSGAPAVFIAGGSGMAPIWSILRDMRERGDSRKSAYFFGALTSADLFYTEELKKLESETGTFSYIPALSGEKEGSGWTGERGLITDVVKRTLPDLTGYEAYLCGSPGMIDACIKVLTESGIPADRIFYDKFS
ncbi:MAG TPA: 2Fe-2S iron-sulfur cluster binding domain-containing protein [Spirochaetota bacterium]|nr:2Fe-2S iron-sulfur cluster binding domain-containing protein [Spirochaetota bacterium]